MRDLVDSIDAWGDAAAGVGRAVVIRTFGSAPRLPGASLLLTEDGRMTGSVSGGCVEGAAAVEIERARETGLSRVIRYGVSDEEAWSVGLSCGGTLDVLIQPFVPSGGPGGRPHRATRSDGCPRRGRPSCRPGRQGTRSTRAPHPNGRSQARASSCTRTIGSSRQPGRLMARARPIRDAAIEAIAARPIPNGHRRRPAALHRGLSRPARAWSSWAGCRSRCAREAGERARLRDRSSSIIGPAFAHASDFPTSTSSSWAGLDEVAERIDLGPADAVAVLSHDLKADVPAMVEAFRRGCRYVGPSGASKRRRIAASACARPGRATTTWAA